MSTIDLVRKLLQEKADNKQLWIAMTYFLSTDMNKDPIGYFVFLKAFPNEQLAREYVGQVIERTGIQTMIAVPACRLMPICKESVGKVIPINVDKDGKLLTAIKENDQLKLEKEKENQKREGKIKEMIDIDQKELENPDSIASIARYWYLYTKYQRSTAYYQEKISTAEKILKENKEKISLHLEKIPEVISYLEDRLSIVKENDQLELIKASIQKYQKEKNP